MSEDTKEDKTERWKTKEGGEGLKEVDKEMCLVSDDEALLAWHRVSPFLDGFVVRCLRFIR
jgi:predicted secreted protein